MAEKRLKKTPVIKYRRLFIFLRSVNYNADAIVLTV